jgi:hypothetical protein
MITVLLKKAVHQLLFAIGAWARQGNVLHYVSSPSAPIVQVNFANIKNPALKNRVDM